MINENISAILPISIKRAKWNFSKTYNKRLKLKGCMWICYIKNQ